MKMKRVEDENNKRNLYVRSVQIPPEKSGAIGE